MDTTTAPLQLASLIGRNLVPLAGVLILGWSAPNLLMLYSVDTSFALASVVMLAAVYMSAPDSAGPRLLNGPIAWLRAMCGVFFFAAFFAVAISIPLYIVLAPFGWSMSGALDDRSFVQGLGLQAAMSATGFIQAYRELGGRRDVQAMLTQRAGFILGRWVVVIALAFFGMSLFAGFLSGDTGLRVVGFVVLVVYVVTTLYFELFPGHVRSWLGLDRN